MLNYRRALKTLIFQRFGGVVRRGKNPITSNQIQPLQKLKKPLKFQRFEWWSVGGSNPWPQDCEPCALPAELTPHNAHIISKQSADGDYYNMSKYILQEQILFHRDQIRYRLLEINAVPRLLRVVHCDLDRVCCVVRRYSHGVFPILAVHDLSYNGA